MELDATTTQRRSIVTPGVWLQTKKVAKQRDIKIMKDTMKKSRSGQAETGSNKRDKQNNLTRTRSRNSVLA
jgi:hypothetical protein